MHTQRGHTLHFLIKVEHVSKTFVVGLFHHNSARLKSLLWVLVHYISEKASEVRRSDRSEASPEPDARTLLSGVDLDSPPTETELRQLRDGHEQRILDAVMARLQADAEKEDVETQESPEEVTLNHHRGKQDGCPHGGTTL